MIQNKLVLYCTRLEQAILWEACKRKNCATSNCQFKKIVKHYGENLWSPEPTRISTITDVKEQLDQLTKPVPFARIPVLDTGIGPRGSATPIYETETDLKSETPSKVPKTKDKVEPSYSLPSDLIRAAIIEKAQSLK